MRTESGHEVSGREEDQEQAALSKSECEVLTELAALLAAGYLRLLIARIARQDGHNPLDSLCNKSDELAMKPTRRRPRA